jgi:dipeptidyl-peptidase-4
MRHAPRLLIAIAVVSIIGLSIGSAPIAAAQQEGLKKLTYEQVFRRSGRGAESAGAETEPVTGQLPTIRGWADATHYLELRTDPEDETRRIFMVSAEDGTAEPYRNYAEIDANLPEGFSARSAAATTPDFARFIFNRDGDLYFYDLEANRFSRLTATLSQENNPRFSPNGRWVAYTRDRNLYAYDLESSVEHQYTSDGSDVVYNGWASWVY